MKLSKATPIVVFLVVLAVIVFFATTAEATTPKPKPIGYTVEQQQRMDQHQDQSQDQTAHGGFGEGGDSYSDVRVETGDVASDSISESKSDATSDNAVAISNVYMSRAFAQDFPITHGCFQGINAGHDETRATKSTGSFLGFTFLNNSCHLQTLASAERDVEIVARLQCGDRKYRRAVAFDNPEGVSKRKHCISIKKASLMGAIEEEKKRLEELASQYKDERDLAVGMYSDQGPYIKKLEAEVADKRLQEVVKK